MKNPTSRPSRPLIAFTALLAMGSLAPADVISFNGTTAYTQDFQTMVDRYLAVGDISTIGAQFAEWKALGTDGFTVSMPAQGHKPEHVEMLGKVLTSL